MSTRAFLHRLKEFVGQRLHHQGDFGLGARTGCCGQTQGNDDQHRPETRKIVTKRSFNQLWVSLGASEDRGRFDNVSKRSSERQSRGRMITV